MKNKRIKLQKKILALALILLLCAENFAAIVNDNDGAAFITKAEFESMKKDFDKQIEQYNNSIDNKIDGAIAAYLAGFRVFTWEPLKLDPKSQYIFPLKMCGPNNEWNNPSYRASTEKNYFDVEVPSMDTWDHWTQWGRHWGGASGGAGQAFNVDLFQMPQSMPASTVTDEGEKNVRVSKCLYQYTFDGEKGTLNALRRTSKTRNINGTNRVVYELKQRGRGQRRAFWRSNSSGWYYDGNASYVDDPSNLDGKVYNYPMWVGLNSSNFAAATSAGALYRWTVPTGNRPAVSTWSRYDGVYRSRGIEGNMRNLMTDTSFTNVEQILTYMNSSSFRSTISGHVHVMGIQNYRAVWADPYLVIPEWEHSNGTNTVYYGTANMQGYLDNNGGNWNLIPETGTSAATQKVAKIFVTDQANNRVQIYNFSSTWSYPTYSPYIPHEYWVIPYWVATDNNSFSQESSSAFSQLRASVVSYIDSNGDTHYCDEGMYLGKFDRNEAIVKFTIEFADTGNQNVDVALSKKPFGFDAATSDQCAFSYSEEGESTKHNVSAGSSAHLKCNRKYDIEIENINKNDKMFMKWVPVNVGHYVELVSFTDFMIAGG